MSEMYSSSFHEKILVWANTRHRIEVTNARVNWTDKTALLGIS